MSGIIEVHMLGYRFRWRLFLAIGTLGITISPLAAQVGEPQGSEVLSYFPQLSDGGPATQHWKTTLIFVNPNDLPTVVQVSFYGDNGNPLALDFGNGPVSTFNFSLPPQGSAIFKSASTST